MKKNIVFLLMILVFCGTLVLQKNKENVLSSTSNYIEEVNKIPTRIEIVDLNIDLEIAPAKIIDGFWEVFDNKASWGEESGYLGENGNQVIFAHNKNNLFGKLVDAKKGMIINIYNGNQKYEYQVEWMQNVKPEDVWVVAATDSSEILTLYTCSGILDVNRFVVRATRVNG